MRTREQIAAEFRVEWDRARATFGLLPSQFVIDPGDPPNGADGYYVGTFAGIAHFQFALAYAPPVGISWSHRYLHEIGHALDDLLRTFGLTKAYIRTRHWAWRFRGDFHVPDCWAAQEIAAYRLSGQDQWSNLPVEMFAETFVVAVHGYVEQERTMNWGIPFPMVPSDARGFITGLVREVSPVVYPTLFGGQPIAKSLADDSLFFYHRAADNSIWTFDWQFAPLGMTKKWW